MTETRDWVWIPAVPLPFLGYALLAAAQEAEDFADLRTMRADVAEARSRLADLRDVAAHVRDTYYDGGGDMTGPLGEALDALDLALAALQEEKPK